MKLLLKVLLFIPAIFQTNNSKAKVVAFHNAANGWVKNATGNWVLPQTGAEKYTITEFDGSTTSSLVGKSYGESQLVGTEWVKAGEAAATTSSSFLEGAVKSNYLRFVSKIPGNSKASASFQQLDDGNYLFQATSPGKVPGSSAMYQKWVNSQGETFKMIKTTFAPDGSIIHLKPKF